MSMNLRFPNITGATEAEQLIQIKSYLHQLVQQLNWMLSTNGTGTAPESASTPNMAIDGAVQQELKVQVYKAINELNSFYDRVNGKLEDYVKGSVFEAYQQEVSQNFENLGETYVGKDDFTEYQESTERTIYGLVSDSVFDAYKHSNDQAVSDLQGEVASLRQMIEDMQNTGGE